MKTLDKYSDFKTLCEYEIEEIDFKIVYKRGKSDVLIMAPHGGLIEPGTSEIAQLIAGENHTFYSFQGIKKTNNKLLHITSTKFDEPIALNLVKNSYSTITIHGCKEITPKIFIGGKDKVLGENLLKNFLENKINSTLVETGYLSGQSASNICNKNRQGKGVQLELSRGLRNQMFKKLVQIKKPKPTRLLDIFINCVNQVLSK